MFARKLIYTIFLGIVFCNISILSEENRYEKYIQKFEAQDKKKPPTKDSILFVGSSSIRLWKSLAEDFPEFKTINRGFGGSQTSDVLYFMDRIVIPYKPKAIIFYCGENDIAAKKSVDTAVEDFKKFLAHVREKLPKTVVYYISMKPSPLRWHMWPKMVEANRKIADFCQKNSIRGKHKTLDYIDISATMIKNTEPDTSIFIKDMLHMNEKGYARWTKVIRSKLLEDKLTK